MNVYKLMMISTESVILETMTEEIVRKVPAYPAREVRIQIMKLRRMLESRETLTAGHVLGSASLKKFNKKQGEHDAAIGAQHRKVKELFMKGLKPHMHQDSRALTNAEFQVWRRKYEKVMAEKAKKWVAEIKEGTSGLLQPGPGAQGLSKTK